MSSDENTFFNPLDIHCKEEIYVVLMIDVDDYIPFGDNIKLINDWIRTNTTRRSYEEGFDSRGSFSAGNIAFHSWFRDLNLLEFLQFIRSLKWSYPDALHILYCYPGNSLFRMATLKHDNIVSWELEDIDPEYFNEGRT